MAVNFPNNPSDQDTFVSSGRTFRFNGTSSVWEVVPGTTSTDVSNLTDTTNIIPADVSDLTDTGGLLGSGGGGATVYADMAALIAATGMSNGDFGLVTANNNIYVYNGSGWYKIATVQNDSPSAITGVNGVYNLATDGTPTVITAVSTDPEGFPLTWSYATSGLGSIATISQADNVFTITPSTNSANDGTFTLTISATDGVNGAVSANTSLTLTFTPSWTHTFSTMDTTWGTTSNVLLSNYGGITNAVGSTWYRSGAIFVSRDGTKMTITDQTGSGRPVDFTMSTPFDPSTLSFAQVGNTYIWAQHAIDYVEDGTKIYYGDQSSVKYSNLSTAFNSNTRVDQNTAFGAGGTIYDLKFSTDGMKLFVLTGNQTSDNQIKTYDLGAAFDTTSRTVSNTFNFWSTYSNNDVRTITSMQFNPIGTVLYVVSAYSGTASTIPLTTAWDLSTAGTYTTGGNLGVGTNIQKALVSWDGNWVYGLRDQQDNAVRLYWKQKP